MDDVTNELFAERIGSERIPERTGERPKKLSPFRLLVESISVVDGVPGLMPQEHHKRLSLFDFAGLLLFDSGKTLIGQVKRNADDWYSIRTAPAVGQIENRLEGDLLVVQLGVEPAS